jgi:hypothetical protein
MTQSSAAPFLRIGTRGSPLALWQAHEVRARLASAHGVAPEAIAIAVIKTSGDMIQDRPLSEVGGKGLFTKEIEQALLDGSVDLACIPARTPTVPRRGSCSRHACPRGCPRCSSAARRRSMPPQVRWSAPRRYAARRWSSGGRTSPWCRFAAM